MKIVAISGLDKAGKHNASEYLYKQLYDEGLNVAKNEFHNYSTDTGRIIKEWLHGTFKASQLTIELIMAANKQEQQEWIQSLEEQGYDVLILDRYMLCQSVYAVASGIDSRWVVELQRYMRKPDLDIYIDIPAEVSMKRKGKFGENDRYESDFQLLNQVRENYKSFSTYYSAPRRYLVDGEQPIDKVNTDVYNLVKLFLGEQE